MLKNLFLIVISFFIAGAANGMAVDTPVYYFKTVSYAKAKVSTADSCDFFRLIYAPEPGQKLFNVKEYYRSGKLKTVTLAPKENINWDNGEIKAFAQQFMSFYESGKRRRIMDFHNDTTEIFDYYENGNLYCSRRETYYGGTRLWECFNNKGQQICNKGNGQWIEYDSDYKKILEQGPIVKGFREGVWHETGFLFDTINYIATYSKGYLKDGISTDKKGHSYTFKVFQESPQYDGGFMDFWDDIKSNYVAPVDSFGKKMRLDSTHVSFVIELDGRVSTVEVLDKVDPKYKAALVNALLKCKGWSCRRYRGIPFRSQCTITARLYEKWGGKGLTRNDGKRFFQEDILAPDSR